MEYDNLIFMFTKARYDGVVLHVTKVLIIKVNESKKKYCCVCITISNIWRGR